MITSPNEQNRYNKNRLVSKYQTAPTTDEPIEIVLFNGKNVNSNENIELLASAGTMLGENILSSTRGIADEENHGITSPPKIKQQHEHSTETFAEAFLGSNTRLPHDGNISTK